MKTTNKTKKKSDADKLPVKKKLLLSICGALIGFINGFFGGGGGMVCVPLLEKVLNLKNKYAHATALVVIFPLSFVSAVIYFLSGNLETIPFLTVGSGVVLGGILGSFLLKFLPSKTIRIIFVFIMLAGGIRLLLWFIFFMYWRAFCLEFLEDLEWVVEHCLFLFWQYF